MKLELNTILQTKDGRKIGNAIVIGWTESKFFYTLKTDYGNVKSFSLKEIEKLFHAPMLPEGEEMLDYHNEVIKSHKHYVKEPVINTEFYTEEDFDQWVKYSYFIEVMPIDEPEWFDKQKTEEE